MFKLGSFWQDEQGSAMVLVCAALVVLIGVTALVVDVGRFYMVDHRLSRVADAAALAGARELPEGAFSSESMAVHYAQKNGMPSEKVEAKADTVERTITVQVWQDVSFLFGRLLVDEDALKLEKTSTATYGYPEAMMGAAPLGIRDHDFAYGEEYVLKVGDNEEYESDLGVGNFGALALGGGGADRFEENLANGYGDILSIGDIVDTESGNMSGATKKAIDERISESLSDDLEVDIKGCPRILWIPVFEPYEESPNKVKKIEVIGFAAFWVNEVEGHGNESEITGYFTERMTSGEISTEAPDFGLGGVRLIH